MCVIQQAQWCRLGTLISYKPMEAAPLISHFNIFRSAEIDGSSPPGVSSTDALAALQALANKTVAPGLYL